MAVDLARMSAGAADFHAAEVRPGPWRWIALAAGLAATGSPAVLGVGVMGLEGALPSDGLSEPGALACRHPRPRGWP